MPVHNSNYRAWDGQRSSPATRWWAICVTGIRRAWKSKWVMRLLFAAFLPLLFFAIPFFLFEQAGRDPNTWRAFAGFVRGLPQSPQLRQAIEGVQANTTPEQIDMVRHDVWAFLLMNMQRYPQAVLMVILVGIVAPPLVSQDLRTRAYLIYFSRPISRMEYILGKSGVVAFYLTIISTLPALILYVTGLLLSPSSTVLLSTWDLPFRILLSSLCLIVPATLMALAISSLTLESRYAAFAWFALWIMGNVAFSALTVLPRVEALRLGQEYDPGWTLLSSPYHVIGKVQSAIFGYDSQSSVLPALLWLLAVSVVSCLILFRRVNAPMRA